MRKPAASLIRVMSTYINLPFDQQTFVSSRIGDVAEKSEYGAATVDKADGMFSSNVVKK